jgi:GH24 family phage-related lysozyme (muramidase)
MRISDAGLDSIREEEGLRLHAYPDPRSPLGMATPREWTRWGYEPAPQIMARLPMSKRILSGKPWTLGFGMTMYPHGAPVQPGDSCTRDEAEVWLRLTVAPFERAILESVQRPLNQKMFDALVEWAYNVGEHAARTSTLVKHINAGRWIEAQEQFDRWVYSGGNFDKPDPVLVQRRNRTQKRFNTGIREALAAAGDQVDAGTLAAFNSFTDDDDESVA